MAQQVDRRVTRYRRHDGLLRALAPRDRPATTWPPRHFTSVKCSLAQAFGVNGECIDQGKWRIDFSKHIDPKTVFCCRLRGLWADAGNNRCRMRLTGDSHQIPNCAARSEQHRIKATGLDSFAGECWRRGSQAAKDLAPPMEPLQAVMG